MPRIHSDLRAIAEELRQAEGHATRLLAELSSAQINWQPNGGQSWSIWQCVNHLARLNCVYGKAMQDATTAPPQRYRKTTIEIAPSWFGNWFIHQMGPNVRTKFKAPKSALPASNGDGQEVLREFTDSHAPVDAVLKAGESIDLNRLRFRNPFVSVLSFTVGTGLLVINAHDQRHLWQAERVKDCAGFPAE